MRADTLVDWREWGHAAFEAAAAADRPVLLSLTASWCTACDEMDEGAYADPRIAARLADGFVPVSVDVDRQPRVRERYGMGGFPSTVFCTPDGRIVTGAGFLSADGLRQALDTVRETWDAKGSEAGRVPRALRDPEPPSGPVTAAVEAHFVEQVAAAFDEEFGGWGDGAKFPLPRTVEFAARRDRDRATRTLEAIRTHLEDTYDGGFYRYASDRNWGGTIHREKLLDENAALLRAFATGYLYTGDETYRDTAADTVDYLTTALWTGDAFAGSQAGGDYYTLDPSDREATDPPVVDDTVYADRNGLAVDALFRFGAYTDATDATRYAERAIEYVLDALVDHGEVTHHDGGGGTAGRSAPADAADGTSATADAPSSESGLLLDQARVLLGLVTGAQATGGYLDVARAVADRTLDLQADDGAFLDGPGEGPGMLDRPLRPLDANVDLADALVDLAALTGEARYRQAAGEALAAFAGAHDRMGAEVAAYGAACARHVHDPLVVETPPAGTDLHRAAWRVADHEKVVVPGDREQAVVVRSGERSEPATTPEELVDRAADAPEDDAAVEPGTDAGPVPGPDPSR